VAYTDDNFFNYENEILKAEGVTVTDIANKVGTPFYVYSASSIINNYNNLALALRDLRHSISYAVKANSNIAVLKQLGKLGAGMDIVSSGEYLRAKAAGIPGHKIVFSGVGKTKDEMAVAIKGGIKQFNVESESELVALNEVAKSFGKRVPTVIRINPDIDAETHEKISTGRSDDKFGIPYNETIEFFNRASLFTNLEVSGLAVHIGSQLTDLNPYKKTFIKIAHLIEGLKDNGHEIKRLDLGGGIGIAYSDDTKVINLEEYAATVKSIFGHFDCEFEFEPGRFIVGNAGLFVCSVIYFKNLKSRNFLVLDGAMNDLMRPAMYDAYHEVVPVRQRKTSSIVKVDIVGPYAKLQIHSLGIENFLFLLRGIWSLFGQQGLMGR
jgi:diaminopimelate decarboxylase